MRLGEIQNLKIIKLVDFGVYLSDDEGQTKVLLPKKQVPLGAGIGDELSVFLYKDSEDRMIATTRPPRLCVGECAVLQVSSMARIGAFLDWGLEKDLFMPFKEMTTKVNEKDEVLVRLYIDKSERLCASMKGIYQCLKSHSPYIVNDTVKGRIYEFSDNFGTFVAVDDKYHGMIKRHEGREGLLIGQVISARVAGVKEDGKLDLSLRKKAHQQIDDDAKKVYYLIEEYAGVLPFTDKADPEIILREAGMSKAAFKRAVGHLYRDRMIEIKENCIRFTDQSKKGD